MAIAALHNHGLKAVHRDGSFCWPPDAGGDSPGPGAQIHQPRVVSRLWCVAIDQVPDDCALTLKPPVLLIGLDQCLGLVPVEDACRCLDRGQCPTLMPYGSPPARPSA
jgi:hypothetical protein